MKIKVLVQNLESIVKSNPLSHYPKAANVILTYFPPALFLGI